MNYLALEYLSVVELVALINVFAAVVLQVTIVSESSTVADVALNVLNSFRLE